MASATRDRIIDSSSELFRRQGYIGTGLKQIVAAANAPFGSIYHFFPGGKEELGSETIRASGQLYLQLFATIAMEAPDPRSAVREFFDGAAETLIESDYADACPIATVALEVASVSERLREATADVFNSWIEGATEFFVLVPMNRKQARELSLTMLSLLEGAFIFCRSLRSVEPLQAAGEAAVRAFDAALAEGQAEAS